MLFDTLEVSIEKEYALAKYRRRLGKNKGWLGCWENRAGETVHFLQRNRIWWKINKILENKLSEMKNTWTLLSFCSCLNLIKLTEVEYENHYNKKCILMSKIQSRGISLLYIIFSALFLSLVDFIASFIHLHIFREKVSDVKKWSVYFSFFFVAERKKFVEFSY